jgi:hypothetical protein
MDNKDKYFKGQQSDETLNCFFRHHWIVLLKDLLYFAIILFIEIYTISNIDNIQNLIRGNPEMKLFFITGTIILTYFFHRFFLHLFNYYVNIGIITDKRIVDHKKTLFFTDTMDAIDLANIQDIERIAEGFLPSILKFGDIKIYLNASQTVKTLHGVPNDKFHFRCINREKEKRQLSLREQSGLIENKKHTPLHQPNSSIF